MAENDGMHKTKSELCRSQSTGSCFKLKSEYVTGELGMLLQQREPDQDSCEERHDGGAQRSEQRMTL